MPPIKNHFSNLIVERLYQTLSTTISIGLSENSQNSFGEVVSLIKRKCAAAQFTIRATINSQYKVSPGEVSFGRHILHAFAKQEDWKQLLANKQKIVVDQAKSKENFKRKFFDYKEQDLVLI